MSVREEIGKRSSSRASKVIDETWDGEAPPLIRRKRSSVLVGQRSVEIAEQQGSAEPTFVVFIIKQYKKWGFFITNHAKIAIVLCVLISSLSTVKIAMTPQRNDITGYTPFEARSRIEYEQYTSFFSHSGLTIASYLFVMAKDGGSMIREEYLREAIKALDVASNNVTMYNRILKVNQSFNQFCMNFCTINEPVRQFHNGLLIQRGALKSGEELNTRIELEYPISTLFGRSVSLQNNFFGIELVNQSREREVKAPEYVQFVQLLMNDTLPPLDDDNTTITPERKEVYTSNMQMVKLIMFQFRAEHLSAWTDDDVKDWEMRFVRFFENYHSENLKFFTLSQTFVEEEMIRAGKTILPWLIVGFFIMATFSAFSVMLRAAYMNQQNVYKVILAVMACITPLMGCSTALAIMFLVGVRFSSILTVIPFLVLSIGVDSSYLMIHEWQRVTEEMRLLHRHKKFDTVGRRMSEVLGEVGPAILISALTNILADAVGCFTSSPEIRLLCIGNLSSMFLAYIYQMTFYSGLMSIVGNYELEAEKAAENNMEVSVKGDNIAIKRHSLSRQSSVFHDTSKVYISKTMKAYVGFMTHIFVSIVIIILYLVYLAISIWGITRMDINLTTQKLFASDSPLLELDQLRVKYEVPHFTMATVFVNHPGDFSNSARLALMNQMVGDFEAINGSWGAVGTMYFVRDFVKFENTLETEPDYDYEPESDAETTTPSDAYKFNGEDLVSFITWPEYDFWSGFIQLSNATDDSAKKLARFFFTTAYHGENLVVWTERGRLMRKWRRVVDKPEYSSFDASVFYPDAIYLDLIDNMPTDTWQSVLGTLVCMGAVCFLFLRSIITVIIASGCVLSICAGILGILSWWGVDLDPITMAAMIISIGFSVDIPAHVSYHYYQACESGPNSTPEERLGNCLSSVAFPAVQAALSTMLCICSLLFAHLYMSYVFVKTMVICILLCNIHGLVVLPAILSLIDRLTSLLKRKKTYVKETSSTRVRNRRTQLRHRITVPDSLPKDQMDRPPVPEN